MAVVRWCCMVLSCLAPAAVVRRRGKGVTGIETVGLFVCRGRPAEDRGQIDCRDVMGAICTSSARKARYWRRAFVMACGACIVRAALLAARIGGAL